MEYIRETTSIQIEKPSVISLGKFDGLHMGHKQLLAEMLRKKQEGLAAVMFTFDIPPRTLVEGEQSGVLTTNAEKEAVFARNGIDYLIEYPFTDRVRFMEPEDFVRLLAEQLNVRCIVAGRDFCFGHNRSGDYRTLERLAPVYGYETIIVEKKQYEGRDISSTFIREELKAGRMERVNMLLGYEYFIKGTVVHGRRIGHEIGIPTVNLLPPAEKLLPPFGVYASRVMIGGSFFGGITNVGLKPTIEGENPVGVETHIFDFYENLYGKEIEVALLGFLRSERKFASIAELKMQMNKDMEHGSEYLKDYKRREL